MTGDFNIRNSLWDSLFPNYSVHSKLLVKIADSFQLSISSSTSQVSMRYADNQNDLNLTIDLMFLQPTLNKFNNHTIYLE